MSDMDAVVRALENEVNALAAKCEFAKFQKQISKIYEEFNNLGYLKLTADIESYDNDVRQKLKTLEGDVSRLK